MRLFIAAYPSPAAVDDLLPVASAIRSARPDLRFSPPEQWHLTLAFLGEVDERDAESLAPRLRRAAARIAPFTAAVRGVGAFPTPARASVLWAGLEVGEPARLNKLVDGVRAAARHTGIDVDAKRFQAHITLARARQAPGDVTETIAEHATYGGPQWLVDRIRLVRSQIGGHVRHERLAEFPMGVPVS